MSDKKSQSGQSAGGGPTGAGRLFRRRSAVTAAGGPDSRWTLDGRTKLDILQRKAAPYVFISPFYILFAIFGLFPILFSLYLSFHGWDGIGPMQWRGLDQYRFLLTDEWFWQSLYNTVGIGLMTGIPQHILGLVLAFMINSKLVRFSKVFRNSYFLPYITSTVALSLIFGIILGTRYGALNYALQALATVPPIGGLLNALNIELPIHWLSHREFIWPSIAMVMTWRWFGWNIVLYLAGLQAIPNELYESAKVDGASNKQIFWKITIPLLRPMMLFAVTMTIIGQMQAFDEPFILLGTGGGPGQAGLTSVLYLYRTGFEWMQLGRGAAMSYLLFVIIIIGSLINFKITGRKNT